MFYINDKFKKVLSPAKWRNLVSAFLNNLCGDGVVEVQKPDKPSPSTPPSIAINMEVLAGKLGQRGIRPVTYRPFEVVANSSSSSTTESTSFAVYLPSLTDVLKYNGTAQTITGVTSIGDGWYTMGITVAASGTTNIYLVDNSATTADTFKFATSATSGKESILVAVVVNSTSADSSITQYVSGYLDIGGASTDFPFKCKLESGVLQVYVPRLVVGSLNGEDMSLSGSTGWRSTGISSGELWLNWTGTNSVAFASTGLTDERKFSRLVATTDGKTVTQWMYGYFEARDAVLNDTDVTQQSTADADGTAWDRNSATGNLTINAIVGFTEGVVMETVAAHKVTMVFGPDGRLKSVTAPSAHSLGMVDADYVS